MDNVRLSTVFFVDNVHIINRLIEFNLYKDFVTISLGERKPKSPIIELFALTFTLSLPNDQSYYEHIFLAN